MKCATEKQLKYIKDLQNSRYDVPEFTGKTVKEACEFISKYKNRPYCIDDVDQEMMLGIEGFEYFC